MCEEEKCGSCGSCGNGCGDSDPETEQEPTEEPQPLPDLKPEAMKAIAHMVNPKNQGLNNFAGIMPMPTGYKDPMLVSATVGLEAKTFPYLQVFKPMAMGVEIVNLAVNDILCTGGDPVFFSDSIVGGMIEPKVAHSIVQGIEAGCDYCDVNLIGGSAEVIPDYFDKVGYMLITGTCMGMVSREDILDGSKVQEGDVLIGIPSAGIHVAGFSVLHSLFKDKKLPWFYTMEEGKAIEEELAILEEAGEEDKLKERIEALKAHQKTVEDLAEIILKPTPLYLNEVMALRGAVDIHGMAHIKNGGLVKNVPNMVVNQEHRGSLTFDISVGNWTPPEVFQRIKTAGEIPDDDMWKIFNNGIGLVVCVPAADEAAALQAMEDEYVDGAVAIGRVIARGEGEDAKDIIIE